MAESKHEAYQLYEKVSNFVNDIVQKREEAEEDFEASKFNFRLYLVIAKETEMEKDPKWRVRFWP